MAFHAIIPAGGVGTRLWPLSRRTHPKFLEDFTGCGRSMLQETYDRLTPIAETQTVVTGSVHSGEVRAQLPQADIIVEPSARGTMGAIGLATALIARCDADALIGSFAADHYIADVSAFRKAVRDAISVAQQGYLVTIGVRATWPSTAYGYIKCGEKCGGSEALCVQEFVEKPDGVTAQAYCDSGQYVWNAGMFIARADFLLDAVERLRPDIARPLMNLAEQWDTPRQAQAVSEYWDSMPVDVIDRVLAEPLAREGKVMVVPADMGWSDVGDFASLADICEVNPGDVPVVDVHSSGAFVVGNTKPVVLVGVEGAVVVETDDVLLVTRRECAQDVKKVSECLTEQGLDYLL